jgi:hypothetical protein
LHFGVKLQQVSQPDTAFELYSIDINSLTLMFWKYKGKSLEIGDCGKLIRYDELKYKPYLRPMSSMTEEEKKEYEKVCELDTEILANHPMNGEPFPALYNSQDWLNAHHFAYRTIDGKDMFELGLALEAPEGMYNINYRNSYE